MIPLHCLWAKSNNRTRDQFECDVSWFRFCFDFVRSHAGRGPLHKQEYKDTKKQIMRLSFEIGWEGGGISLEIGLPMSKNLILDIKTWWKNIQLSTLHSRHKNMALTVKNYTKANMKVFFFMYNFALDLFQIFC